MIPGDNDRKLRIGRIAYTNLFPIFYGLQRKQNVAAYEFIDGVPSELNRKIRDGEIDISPSSSIEYLKNRSHYRLIEGHSISSFGPVGSVLLFSKQPIETLEGRTVLTSPQSETSVALLSIILKKFYGIDAKLISAPESGTKSGTKSAAAAMRAHEAWLLIGDDAMKEALLWPQDKIYDLGDLWYRHTGLPAVFALWIARNTCCEQKPELLRQFMRDLEESKSAAPGSLREIAGHSWLRHIIPVEELVAYWEGISYDFLDEHRKGLELFRSYAEELGLIQD
ncbi:MAG: menaquinone biosynthesis protein [Thermodesulfovibrionales bacterium]